MIPNSVIEQCIFPFISDRVTWNRLSMVNTQFHEASKSVLPPWPTTSLNVGRHVTCVSFSPCGTLLAVATDYPVIRIWNVRGKRAALTGHADSVRCLAFSFDSQYLISGGDDAFVRVWSARDIERRTGAPLSTTSVILHHPPLSTSVNLHHGSKVSCVASSPTSSIFAIGGEDGVVKLWRIQDYTCIRTFAPEFDANIVNPICNILSVSFPRRGSQECVAAEASNGLFRVWNLSDYDCTYVRFANPAADLAGGFIKRFILSDGGTWSARVSYSASVISSIVLYELRNLSPAQMMRVTGFRPSISSLFFSPGAIISNTNANANNADDKRVQIFFLCNDDRVLIQTIVDCMLLNNDAITSAALDLRSVIPTLAFGSHSGVVRLRKATLVPASISDTR